jgi:hypothetical protein
MFPLVKEGIKGRLNRKDGLIYYPPLESDSFGEGRLKADSKRVG